MPPPGLQSVAAHLATWLPAQRWFGGKGRRIRRVSIVDHAALPGSADRVILALIQVIYDDDEPERYFVPLVAVRDGEVGPLGGFDDALADAAACRALLSAIERSERVRTPGGLIVFERGQDFDLLRQRLVAPSARLLAVDQSNTSVVFGDAMMLKCFRRVPYGPNPDLEIARFLATRTGFRHFPRLAGAMTYEKSTDGGGSLGILQEFVQSKGDGWSYTLRTLEASQPDGSSAYLDDIRLLATVTAELHLALASDATAPDFAPEPVEEGDLNVWRGGAFRQVLRAARALQRAEASLDERLRALARPVLSIQADFGRRLFERLASFFPVQTGSLMRIRYHGDYHLGQLLKTSDGWVVLDFEGEPLRSLAERRAKHCPLKDVAGMLRSFSYAHHATLRARPGAGAALKAWEQGVREAFLAAYFERAEGAAFMPHDPRDSQHLLRAFELEKAAYELEYELNNRPEWIEIPLAALARLV